MELQLLNRSLALTSPPAFQQWHIRSQIDSIQAAHNVRFDGNGVGNKKASGLEAQVWAHRAGVNALTIDRFEGRFLLSGGADSTIHLWDLTAPSLTSASTSQTTLRPVITAPRNASAHTHGITTLSFYAFDSGAFLSSSYDHTLKIGSTHTLEPTASFSLGSVVHSHAMSPIASHVLVACATQSSVVRLVDLKSGGMTQGLLGHHGDVLAVAWSPRRENVLASAGADGTVRLWDVRRSAGCLGMLDLEDEIGLLQRGGEKMWGKAHVGPCNGLAWTEDGEMIVTAGHDERIRVWEASTGKNTLVHFGAGVRNKKLATVQPVLVRQGGRQLLVWPNEREMIVGDLLEGKIIKRLRPAGVAVAQGQSGKRAVKERVMGAAWRGSGYVEVYSAHADGMLRAWIPDGGMEEEEGEVENGDDETTKKRKALEELHRDLTRQKITFT
ncbi:hypothetical protein MMC10_005816 [Thelotrema lepadinum]|nr:hypothetical protein [Thelotrema lepadinum]